MADQHFDDDEAPEEFTLNEGREEAEKSRKEEKEMKKRIAAELKQRRKSMSGEKRKEVLGTATESTGEEAADLPRTMERMSRKGRHGDGKSFVGKTIEERDPGTVMLDDSVLKLIQAKQLQVAMGASQAKHIYIKEKKIKKSSRPALEINTDSRTKIVSLKSRPKSAATTTNAVEFRQSQMFGQYRRSHSMLSTVSKPFKASV